MGTIFITLIPENGWFQFYKAFSTKSEEEVKNYLIKNENYLSLDNVLIMETKLIKANE
jgi:hypothetical protein